MTVLELQGRLQKFRDWILQGEVCSLLHDLGKLSGAFLRYRRTWYADPKGYDKDPHENEFLLKTETKENKDQFAALLEALGRPLSFRFPEFVSEGKFSPASVMSSHVKPSNRIIYELALKEGDSIDAAQDRNNPLWSCEQTDRRASLAENLRKPCFRSNVFGFEGEETHIAEWMLDKERKSLYRDLSKGFLKDWPKTPSWDERKCFLAGLEAHFECACSDTTRPDNDTSLWEHAYAVATITKALQAHYAIYGEGKSIDQLLQRDENKKTYFQRAHFTLFGVGWDAIRFISRAQRIYDLKARQNVLANVREAIRYRIEHFYALGNCVYEDDGAIIFLVPEIRKGSEFADFWLDIQQAIVRDDALAGELPLENCKLTGSEGEVWPYFAFLPVSEETQGTYLCGTTRDTTRIVDILKELRRERPTVIAQGPAFDSLDIEGTISSTWTTDLKKDVCPICGLRPAVRQVEVGRICAPCEKRRKQTADEERGRGAGTPFINEIADSNGRVALLVGHFGLDNWLNGRMIRSMFVKEARTLGRELRELGLVPQFEEQELAIQNELQSAGINWTDYNYNRILYELQLSWSAKQDPCLLSKDDLRLAKNTFFLYGQRVKGKNINQYPENKECNYWEELPSANSVLSKTPTPSTILDVWRTTGEFFRSVSSDRGLGGSPTKPLLYKMLKSKERLVFLVSSEVKHKWQPYALYEGELHDGGRIEFYFEKTNDRSLEVHITADAKAPELTVDMKNIKLRVLKDPEGKTQDFYLDLTYRGPEPVRPYREIIATPDMLLVLVPAEDAIPVTAGIVAEFRRLFGKVWGRLPFSIGHIFFQQHFPMFAALDSARRMLRNFGKLDEAQQDPLTVKTAEWDSSLDLTLDNGLRWELPLLLGDGGLDYHHPYLVTNNATPVTAASYCDVPDVGAVIHAIDVRPGTKVVSAACYYDFEFLDSSAARFRLALSEGLRSNPNLNDSRTRPIRLEAFDQHIVRTWEIVAKSGIADAGLRDMLDILLAKLQEWKIELPMKPPLSLAQQEWLKLAGQQLTVRFPMYGSRTRAFLEAQIRSGLFFETAALYLHILKQGVSTTKERYDLQTSTEVDVRPRPTARRDRAAATQSH